MKPQKSADKRKSKAALMLGVGLDNKDDHKRITKGENFAVVGGSAETHERLTVRSIKFNEKLKEKGKALGEISAREFFDIHSSIND